MRFGKRKIPLAAEMATIVLVAALTGLVWNHRILRDVAADKAIGPATQQTTAPTAAAAPLPLGLQQAKELYDRKEATFVDARDRGAYAAGHIKGARSLPLGEFDAGIAGFKSAAKPDATLVVYCNGFDCHDSNDLAGRLIKAGYTSVYVFLGGFPEWKDAEYAVEGGTP